MSSRARCAVAVVIATVAFSVALALRERVDPWRATALAATVGIALSIWALGGRARALFTVTARGALGAVALGAALVAATHAVFHLAAIASPELARSVGALYASIDVGTRRITLVIVTAVVVVAEELVWRGALVELAGADRSKLAVGAISVGGYVLPQLAGGQPVLILAAIGLGTLFAAQRIVSGRLTEPILTHAVWSVAVFVVFPLA